MIWAAQALIAAHAASIGKDAKRTFSDACVRPSPLLPQSLGTILGTKLPISGATSPAWDGRARRRGGPGRCLARGAGALRRRLAAAEARERQMPEAVPRAG